MPEQKILAGRLSGDEMHARIFKATVYEIFRLSRTEGKADGFHQPEGSSPEGVRASVQDTTGV
jgi:hypothetical protein